MQRKLGPNQPYDRAQQSLLVRLVVSMVLGGVIALAPVIFFGATVHARSDAEVLMLAVFQFVGLLYMLGNGSMLGRFLLMLPLSQRWSAALSVGIALVCVGSAGVVVAFWMHVVGGFSHA